MPSLRTIEQLADGVRGIVFAAFFAGPGREALGEVHVGVADDVFAAVAPYLLTEVEAGLVKVGDKVLEQAVALFGRTKAGFVVEVDAPEHPFELGAVSVFNAGQDAVDEVAEVMVGAVGDDVVEGGAFGHHEPLAAELALEQRFVVSVLGAELLTLVIPDVGEVLEEEEHKDVILVLGAVDGATEGVAGAPEGGVDLVLGWALHAEG